MSTAEWVAIVILCSIWAAYETAQIVVYRFRDRIYKLEHELSSKSRALDDWSDYEKFFNIIEDRLHGRVPDLSLLFAMNALLPAMIGSGTWQIFV